MLGPLTGSRMQSIADCNFDFNIIGVKSDFAQIVDALGLRHLRGDAELLQELVGPSKECTLALGLGARVCLGIGLGKSDDVRHYLFLVAKKSRGWL